LIATTAQDATAFPFGRTAPYAVLNAVLERVFQALEPHLAAGADAPSGLDTESVGREELRGAGTAAQGVQHPRVLVRGLRVGHSWFNGGYGFWVPGVHDVVAPSCRR
jgi:hypothetical protein